MRKHFGFLFLLLVLANLRLCAGAREISCVLAHRPLNQTPLHIVQSTFHCAAIEFAKIVHPPSQDGV
jgi:hypothetical protein